MSFEGFPPATLKFLAQLKKNNNRDWFQKNKNKYEDVIVAPSLAFIAACEKPLKSLSPCLTAIPRKTGGSLMRIYRDTRFSKNKQPYKENIGIQFRHQSGKDVHAPGLYLHIESGGVFLAAGVWHPESQPLARIRQRIVDEPRGWKRARDSKPFQRNFELDGDALKRPPRGFDADHPLIEDIKRKDFIAVARCDPRELEKPEFARQSIAVWKTAKPLMAFLCAAMDVPF